MNIFCVVLFHFLSFSLVIASNDPWDLNMNVESVFQNSKRSIYLHVNDITHVKDHAIPYKSIRFSIVDKSSKNVVGKILAQYYGPLFEEIYDGYKTRIIFGFDKRCGNPTDLQKEQSIRTLVGIFKARPHLDFGWFETITGDEETIDMHEFVLFSKIGFEPRDDIYIPGNLILYRAHNCTKERY